jgi:FG-GAP-like repeat
MRTRTLVATCAFALSASLAEAQTTASFTRVGGDFAVGTSPLAVITADLNGDKILDVATANSDSGDVTVLTGQGDGSLVEPGTSYAVGSPGVATPSALAVADLNGDALPDLVVTDDTGSTVSVLLNQGNGVFGTPIVTDTGNSPEAVVVGDFNGDGKADVAIANNLDDTVSIFLGTGDGHLIPPSFCSNQATQACTQDSDCGAGNTCTPTAAIAVGSSPIALAAADLDGDGKIDVVVANYAGGDAAAGTLTVLKGVGDGTFVAQPEITSDSFNAPVALAVTDFDGDGKADIVAANEQGDSVSVLLGNGDLTFPRVVTASVSTLPESVVVSDFNNDGKPDIATSGNLDDTVSVLLGNGDGSFMPEMDFGVGTSPTGLAVGDLNKDGLPDIISANVDDDTVSVLLNTTGQATPTPTVATPMPTPTPTGSPAAVCTGDCHGTGSVAVTDIVTLVNIVLGNSQPSACPDGIPGGTSPSITTIIQAVTNVLNGCPQ